MAFPASMCAGSSKQPAFQARMAGMRQTRQTVKVERTWFRIERQGSADSRIGRHDGCVPPCQRDQRVLASRHAAPHPARRGRRHRGRADGRGAAGVAAGPAVVVKHGETVTIDGVRNIVMHADQAKGGILLLTGGDGRLNVTDGAQFTDGADNVLIRNRDAFAARG